MDCNILISIRPSVITVWQGSSRTKKNKKWIRHTFFNFWNYFLVAGRAALSNVRSLLNVSQRWSARRARTQFPCCWPPDRVLRIINHIPQFTPSSWGRPGDIMSACDWLPAVFVCEKEEKKERKKNKKKCGNAVSAPPWHGALMQSQVPLVSSDVPLSGATIVFVLDAVRALIVNWSNYSGPCPPSGNNACNGRSWCVCWSSCRGLQPYRERWWGDEKSKHMNSWCFLIVQSRAVRYGWLKDGRTECNVSTVIKPPRHPPSLCFDFLGFKHRSISRTWSRKSSDCSLWTVDNGAEIRTGWPPRDSLRSLNSRGQHNNTLLATLLFICFTHKMMPFCFLPSTGNKHVEFRPLACTARYSNWNSCPAALPGTSWTLWELGHSGASVRFSKNMMTHIPKMICLWPENLLWCETWPGRGGKMFVFLFFSVKDELVNFSNLVMC